MKNQAGLFCVRYKFTLQNHGHKSLVARTFYMTSDNLR